MELQECPRCQNEINPPLQSIGFQLCTSCGWSEKQQTLQKDKKLTVKSINNGQKTLQKDLPIRKTYQFLQIRVKLRGKGLTNNIINLHVNGKKLKPNVKTMHELLNFLGIQGFRIVTAESEIESTYTHFYTMEREIILTQNIITKDIFETLDEITEGSDFGDSASNLLESTLM